MPIDHEQLARAFRTRMRREIFALGLVLTRLGEWLDARVKAVEVMERASRRFPVVRFRDEGVTLWIDSQQWGALLSEEERGADGHTPPLRRAFLAPFEEAAAQIRQEMILPQAVKALLRAAFDIERSVDRFVPPTPAIFGPGRASDLFGVAVLALSSAFGGLGRLRVFIADVRLLGRAVTAGLPPPERAEGDTGAQESGSYVEALETITRGIAGALLVLPLLPGLAGQYLGDAVLRAKISLLDAGEGLEQVVFGLRQQVLTLFGQPERTSWLLDSIRRLGDVAVFFLQGFLNIGRRMLVEFLQNWIELGKGLRSILQEVTATALLIFDVLDKLLAAMGRSAAARWTAEGLAELLTLVGYGAALRNVGDDVRTLSQAYRRAWREKSLDPLAEAKLRTPQQLLGARQLARVLKKLPEFQTRPTVAPPRPQPMGDLYQRAIAPSVPWLTSALRTARRRIPESVAGLGEVDFGVLDTDAATAALLLPGPDGAALARGADRATEDLLGEERRRQQARVAATRVDALAQAFDDWLIHDGFHLLGQAIPAYVVAMDRWWGKQTREQTIEGMTSPRIVAKRLRLRGVHLKEMTIRAGGRALDAELARDLALEIRRQVSAAYRAGRERAAKRMERATKRAERKG